MQYDEEAELFLGSDINFMGQKIFQIVPTFHTGDAVGNYCVFLDILLNSLGYETKTFCIDFNKIDSNKVFSISSEKWWNDKAAIIIYHFSISSKATKYFIKAKGKKILLYHNITPSHFFHQFDNELAQILKGSQKQLRKLSTKVDLALGVSNFNQDDLIKSGFKKTGILPISIDFDSFKETIPDKEILLRYNDHMRNILFVGRIVPHKRHNDILKAFYFYQKINPESRLIFVGPMNGMLEYYGALLNLQNKLGLKNVFFAGKVSFPQLLAYYNLADLFLSMSEHEGFGVPILEAFYFKIPVIAYKSTALSETLGNAGLLVNQKNHELTAELMNYILSNDELKNKIVESQSKRLLEFSKDRVREDLKKHLNQVINN